MIRPAYLTFGVDPTSTDPVFIADAVASAFGASGSLFSVIDNSVQMIQARVALGTDGGGDLVGVSNTVVSCTKSIASPPANCAVLVHKYTTLGGRRGRGRMYIPWACSGTLLGEEGKLAAADITAVGAAFNVFRVQLATSPGPMVLLHSQGVTPVGTPTPVTTHLVDPLIATQRRRLGRR